MLSQFLINGFIMGLMYAIASLGFSLVYNTNKIFHIAYSSLFVIAGYIFYFFSVKYFHFPFYASLFLSVFLTALISLIIYQIVYKPLITSNSSKNVIMISSIGVMIILTYSITMLFDNQSHLLQKGIPTIHKFAGYQVTNNQLLELVFSIIVIFLYLVSLYVTKIGIIIRGVKDDEILLNILGINSKVYQAFIFFMSGILIAFPGCLISFDNGISPYMGMAFFLNVVVGTVIGGLGNFYSPVIGGILLGLIQAISSFYIETRWTNAVTFVILLIFLFIKPTGLVGEKNRAV